MTVFVGPSIWRDINVRTMTALMVAMNANPGDEPVQFAPIWNDALIGRSRSLMCTEFLKTDADVMVIIDDDIVPTDATGDFWKIVEGARETRGVYGAAYVTRSTEPYLTSRAFPDHEPYHFAHTPQRRPVEFQYLATGWLALHRDVLEAMIDKDFKDADGGHRITLCELGADRPFYPFFMPYQCLEDDGRRHYLSEDWAFSRRARELGFGVWVDQSIILQHMGQYPYTVADLGNPGSAFPSRGIDRAIFTPDLKPSLGPLVDTLIEDIAEWAQEDLGDARRMVEEGKRLTHELFVSKPEEQTEAEWYAREDVGMAYVGDLASWHLRGNVPAVIEEPAGKRVFDFGAGIGTYALTLAQVGAEVTVFEPSPVMREFMGFRAIKHGLDLDIHSTRRLIPPQDAVVCWHVFEHLPNPEETLDYLLSLLKPGGQFITDDGFADQHTPQHHSHADWGGVLASRGLRAISPGVYEAAEGGGNAGEVAASALNPFPSPSLAAV